MAKVSRDLEGCHKAGTSCCFLLGAPRRVPVYQTDDNGNVIRGPDGRPRFEERPDRGFLVRRYRPRVEGIFARIERWTTGKVRQKSRGADNLFAGLPRAGYLSLRASTP